MPTGVLVDGTELGPEADAAKTYLSLQVRVRKEREGVTLVPQAASALEGLLASGASENVRQAGPGVPDGDFETLTYYYALPIEDSPGGKGFIRLNATLE